MSWLAEFVPDLPDAETVAELLTGIGLAAEEIDVHPGVPAGVLAVRLQDLKPVPESDHLQSATAFAGERSWQVVTGAPNAAEGLITAFAPPGTKLPGLDTGIGVRVMAGLQSEGMLLSPREMGVFDHAAGLIELPDDIEPGADLAALWPSDTVITLELTANRADCFSILGVARDLCARLGRPLSDPLPAASPAGPASSGGISVSISDPGCTYLTVQRIDGVKVAPSPLWLQRRLATVGLRPRNNLVDATNYVTIELGQPSHAYDADGLQDGNLGVRKATAGEKLTVLGGEELELDPADLVIVSGDTVLGLAGVIGGEGHSVSHATTSVALEIAHFKPRFVRATARRHRQHTDAHYRFERGVDPDLPLKASARVTGIITGVAGGHVPAAPAVAGGPAAPRTLEFDPASVEFLTTLEVEPSLQREYLESLGFTVDDSVSDRWQVGVPSWRFDMTCQEDLIEEIARLYGYDRIGETVPHMRFTPPQTDPTHRQLRRRLAVAGFQELISYVFTGQEFLKSVAAPESRHILTEPQGLERGVLRTALYPGLLNAAVVNRARPSLALFEVGSVFLEDESERVALLLRGPWQEPGWRQPASPSTAFTLKGQLEKLASSLGASLELRNEEFPHLHPGVSASVWWNGRKAGFLGQLHPSIAAGLELPDVFIAELDLPLDSPVLRFSEPGRQQHADRDIAVVVPANTEYAALAGLLEPAAGQYLTGIAPFDVYRGERLGEGLQSVALRFTFRHPSRALTDAEINEAMTNVIRVAQDAGYDVRGS